MVYYCLHIILLDLSDIKGIYRQLQWMLIVHSLRSVHLQISIIFVGQTITVRLQIVPMSLPSKAQVCVDFQFIFD